jgi:capsular exopolysaccharide synthesis family protein
MSYIFEALQRAEAERAGESVPKDSESVAELLRGVEEEIARKQLAVQPDATGGTLEEPPANAEATSLESTTPEPTNLESTKLESTNLKPTNGQFAGATSVADLLHEVKPEFTREQGAAAPVREREALPAGAELSARPVPVAEPEIRTQQPISPAPPLMATTESFDAETFAGAKVLSPTVAADSKLVCLTDQGGLAAEKFRVLGLKLRNLRERRKLRRIVVTGTAPEEGKSLVAANLALNQSRSKVLKTLLVDGDLRRPTVASRFGFDRGLPGLSECLRGERKLSDVVYKLSNSGLYLLPAGRAPENPLDLMQSGRLPELLDRLGTFFDWIVIDTPPVIPVADTTFWMKLADGVLVVIREGVSEKKVVERALDSFDRSALLGIVVNSCSSTDHKDYYSRYSQSTMETGRAAPSPPGQQ